MSDYSRLQFRDFFSKRICKADGVISAQFQYRLKINELHGEEGQQYIILYHLN